MTKQEFKYLFDTYFNSVRSFLFYRGAGLDEASDIAQDVFLKLWEKQLDVEPRTAIRLLYKIASDMFISKYRKASLEHNYLNSLTTNNSDNTPEDELDFIMLQENFKKALAGLNEKNRTVFLMAKLEGLKYHEIADRLKISVKAVEKRMSTALSFLRKNLQVDEKKRETYKITR